MFARVQRGAKIASETCFELLDERARLIRHANGRTAAFDVLAFPTVRTCAPRFADIETAECWSSANAAALHNASVVNLLDRCAISLPCHAAGEVPVGLMLVGDTMADANLLAIAAAVELTLARVRWR